ncbi:hypothetical protein [Tautonia sociabilis]|uniref:Uncharacterized protein n=1 Tax=Tautonia sociabilis TaxID=2080755 RepID=A0A432MKN5_9BACT|nr:hypothetical protein [Tautonia sociabilis]RUL87972.1 hypothetical protein TsocGM_09625 [Tautonia sociabilis]
MRSKKRLAVPVLVVMVAGVGAALSAAQGNRPQGPPPPEPFGTYLVYSAAGVYDPSIPPAEGDLALWFHRDVMGRGPAQIAAERARADAYFQATFGVPPGRSSAFGLDPRNEYRAYVVSGENVPPEGWVVRDGGFMVTIGAGGATLRGTWGGPSGRWVPEGTVMVFGDYNIAAPGVGNGRRGDREIIIHYESAEPIIPNPFQEGILFQCRLTSDSFDDFGGGLAQGISIPRVGADGRLVANIRNVLTFPGLGFDAE